MCYLSVESGGIMAGRAQKIGPQKAVTSDPDIETGHALEVDEAAIAARAHEIWLERGCPIGSDQEDWFQAERELNAQARKEQREGAAGALARSEHSKVVSPGHFRRARSRRVYAAS
jgi:uncharacterized membrane protein